MKKLKLFLYTLLILCSASASFASVSVFNPSVSKDSLRTLKRMEYKEGVPNGLLHAISLVETNIGQTGKYMPWPYTIRLNRYKGDVITDVDVAFEKLEYLIDLGYKTFDLTIDGDLNYSLSAIRVEEVLANSYSAKEIKISSRSLINYFKDKKESSEFLNRLIKKKWYNFKVGIMQLDYNDIKALDDVTDSLNAYDNINIMVKKIKTIRKQHTWWESVGFYHSKKPAKAKRYVKNVWSMYQRVHKIKVR